MEERVRNDEISLKELILALIKRWKLIVGVTLAFAVVAGIYLWGIAEPVYESEVGGTIRIPESIETRYGSYMFPSTNQSDYLSYVTSERVIGKWVSEIQGDLSIGSAKELVSVKNDADSSQFVFTVKSNSPELAKSRLEALSQVYLDEIRLLYKQNALAYFEKHFTTSVSQLAQEKSTLEEELKNQKSLIDEIDPVISLKRLVVSNPVYAAEVAKERQINLEDLSGEMMYEEVLNPNYQDVEAEIIRISKALGDLEIKSTQYNGYVEEIQNEERVLYEHTFGNGENSLRKSYLNVLEPHILIGNYASLPEAPIAPRKMFTLAIATILGGMLGIFVALFSAYWRSEH